MQAVAMALTHLQRLEAESIHILREVVAECDNPVMLYSIGKDSAVMLHLARKAFFPSPLPFPLLHVDTTWKFRAMYALRQKVAAEPGMRLLVHVNEEGLALGINPFTHGSQVHTDVMKTQGLKQALDQHGFDAAFGGARRGRADRTWRGTSRWCRHGAVERAAARDRRPCAPGAASPRCPCRPNRASPGCRPRRQPRA
jgi:3'-phosphoadenosine 5'-phosphosulfate sulfotransferase (PAPS reductase)/FAD synthetase